MKKYSAICGAEEEGKENYTKSGFNSEEEAREYIKSKLCESCKVNASSLDESPCFAEWLIEEYDDKNEK